MLSRQSLNILSSLLFFFSTSENKSMNLMSHGHDQISEPILGRCPRSSPTATKQDRWKDGGRIGQKTCLQLPHPAAHATWASWAGFKWKGCMPTALNMRLLHLMKAKGSQINPQRLGSYCCLLMGYESDQDILDHLDKKCPRFMLILYLIRLLITSKYASKYIFRINC